MLIIFFDCEGVVHYEFAPKGQTINKEYYVEVLKRLRDATRRKRPRFWSSSLRLLDVPEIENGVQRKAVRRHRDYSE